MIVCGSVVSSEALAGATSGLNSVPVMTVVSGTASSAAAPGASTAPANTVQPRNADRLKNIDIVSPCGGTKPPLFADDVENTPGQSRCSIRPLAAREGA